MEVYEEALGRWRRLPCNVTHEGNLGWTGSALMCVMTRRRLRTKWLIS
jgi:hypothetical protein